MLAGAQITRRWACQRTFTDDRKMRLGRDATRPWLVWAAGLGGHGATASPAVGERVANAVVEALGGCERHFASSHFATPSSPSRSLAASAHVDARLRHLVGAGLHERVGDFEVTWPLALAISAFIASLDAAAPAFLNSRSTR